MRETAASAHLWPRKRGGRCPLSSAVPPGAARQRPWTVCRPRRLDRRDDNKVEQNGAALNETTSCTGLFEKRDRGHSDCASVGRRLPLSGRPSARTRLAARWSKDLEEEKSPGRTGQRSREYRDRWYGPFCGAKPCRRRLDLTAFEKEELETVPPRRTNAVRGERQEGNGRGDTVRLRRGGILRGVGTS